MNNTETGCRTGAVVDVSNLDATYVDAKVGILNRHANAKDAKKKADGFCCSLIRSVRPQ